MDWRNVVLELSLKPFGDPSEPASRAVLRRMFEQWAPLCRRAETVSVLLWAADGSEILDYRGDLDLTFEWACWLGGANPRLPHPNDPDRVGLHARPYPYMAEPPALSYRWLRGLVGWIRQTGAEVTGRPTRVGATFDPGPEFAVSPFKYERHNEICASGTMGKGSFVVCYATLEADDVAYAGFPDGIPAGTSIGTFLGRQSEHFLRDLGFDYLWLSNGFGFGLETWALRGAVFDGTSFDTARCSELRDQILGFWRDFRAECPTAPLETRGTNLSTGMDLASDAAPLRDIYRGGFDLLPPPNSPWAALNGDFGLELVGWMSHLAELPDNRFPFRFYTHDPWWCNSPWIDRYGREPHDLYLPLAVGRLDGSGTIQRPTSLHFLTVDDSWGNLPDLVPREVIAHLLAAWETGPDAVGPLIWVYPFDEYHDWTYGAPSRVDEVFFGDWFMRGAVNHGLPLNTVTSTRSLAQVEPAMLSGSVLVSPVPDAGSEWEARLLDHAASGGDALLYGPLRNASTELRRILGVELREPIDGELALSLSRLPDRLPHGLTTTKLRHPALFSAGGIEEVADGDSLATVAQAGQSRSVALIRPHGAGRLAWVRGTVSCDPSRISGHLLMPYQENEAFAAERLLRYALAELGCEVLVDKPATGASSGVAFEGNHPPRWPLLVVSRHQNGFYYAGYTPATTVALHLRMPQGAPLFINQETVLADGRAVYHPTRAWRREARVFVEQSAGEVGCAERSHSEQHDLVRRLLVSGLQEAVVRFYHVPGSENSVRFLRNPVWPFIRGELVPFAHRRDRLGDYLELREVTGDVMISW